MTVRLVCIAIFRLFLSVGLIPSLPAIASIRTSESVVNKQEEVFVARNANGSVSRFVVNWVGIVQISQKQSDKSLLPGTPPSCRLTISARIERTVSQVDPLGKKIELGDLSRTYSTAYASKEDGLGRSFKAPCNQESQEIRDEMDRAKVMLQRSFQSTIDLERFLVPSRLQAITQAEEVIPERVRAGVVMLLRGGQLDENLVKIYKILHKKDLLRTKTISLNPEKTLRENLLHTRVLFQIYPASFDSLLLELNRHNKDVTLVPGKSVRWNGFKKLIVPDIKLQFDEYTLTIELQEERLSDAAWRLSLVRYYDEELGKMRPFPEQLTKIKKLRRLNPELADHPDFLSLKHGKIVFPADGVKLTVPREFVNMTKASDEVRKLYAALLEDNVYFAGIGVVLQSTPLDAATARHVPDAQCSDSHYKDFLTHLKAITYSDELRVTHSTHPHRVFVLDDFKPMQPGLQGVDRIQKAYQNLYQSYAQDKRITPSERENLDRLQKDLDISPADAQRLEQEVMLEHGLHRGFIVNLALHPEFQHSPGKGGTCHSPSEPPGAGAGAEPRLPDLQPDSGDHGYHISSIIAAFCNDYGIKGLASGVRMIAYRLLRKGTAAGQDRSYILPYKALEDIVDNGECAPPCIVNMSWSEPFDTQQQSELSRIISDPNNRGKILVVAAAGNAKQGSGQVICDPHSPSGSNIVPACLGASPNVITVTAGISPSAKNKVELPMRYAQAHFGKHVVSIAAPGVSIPGAGYACMFLGSGTSQATAFVTAILSLLQHRMPWLTPQQLKERLLYTADLETNLKDNVKFGWLNAHRALFEPGRDVVYFGGPKMREITDLETDTEYRYLHTYVKGSQNDNKLIELRSIRRIYQQRDGRYTVIYREKDTSGSDLGCQLMVRKDVDFLPVDERGKRLPESFIMKDRKYLLSRFTRKETGSGLDLNQISDLIIHQGGPC